MSTSSRTTAAPSGSALIITRVFDAPRDLVWRTWTDPDHLMRWWGPKDFTAPVWEIDFRIGGRYHYCMRAPDGKDYWATGEFREIVPMERIVFTDSFADKDGNVVAASDHGLEGEWPRQMLVTLTFESITGGTKFTLRHDGLPEGPNRDLTGGGWNESFDKLADHLARVAP